MFFPFLAADEAPPAAEGEKQVESDDALRHPWREEPPPLEMELSLEE